MPKTKTPAGSWRYNMEASCYLIHIVSYCYFLSSTKFSRNRGEDRDASLGKLHRGDVEAVEGYDGFGGAEVGLSDVDRDFAFFAWEKGDVVVVKEDG